MSGGFHLALPAFLDEANARPLTLHDDAERMAFVLDLVDANVAAAGGPFAAAVFEEDSGRLLAAGANRVVAARCSTAHAEIVALSLAQQRLASFDLGAGGLPSCTLVSSAEPCAMCIGAVLWSGVRRLVYGATAADIESAGFDEGPRHPAWADELGARGIAVAGGLFRQRAAGQIDGYRRAGGRIYNGRQADR